MRPGRWIFGSSPGWRRLALELPYAVDFEVGRGKLGRGVAVSG